MKLNHLSIEFVDKAMIARAEAGDPDAQFSLGCNLLNAPGDPPGGIDLGFEWLRKSARQGHLRAKIRLIGMLIREMNYHKDQELLDWFKVVVENSDAKDQDNYANMMEWNGSGSFELLKSAAKQRNVQAMTNLARAYLDGWSCQQDYKRGRLWMTRAALTGDPQAMALLGIMYAEGIGCDQSDERALALLRPSVEQKINIAMVAYGKIMEKRGTNEGFLEAIKHYEMTRGRSQITENKSLGIRAIYGQDGEGLYRLGRMHEEGRGGMKSVAEAAKLYREALERTGYQAGPHTFFNFYKCKGWWEQDTIRYVRDAAERGIVEAQAEMGVWSYFESEEGCRERSLAWFELAAAHGNALGEYGVGAILWHGWFPGREEEAEDWFRLASEKGLPEAQEILGYLLSRRGEYMEAAKWSRLAAEQGMLHAQIQLGQAYYEGKGVEKDMAEAVKWLRLALETNPLELAERSFKRIIEPWRKYNNTI
jgi:uncharacterized protein